MNRLLGYLNVTLHVYTYTVDFVCCCYTVWHRSLDMGQVRYNGSRYIVNELKPSYGLSVV